MANMRPARPVLQGMRRKRPESQSRLIYHVGSKPCQFQGYKCPLNSLEDFAFCYNHILNDGKAPFQQCGYTYQYTNKRCRNAAYKNDFSGDSYCYEHNQRLQRPGRRAQRRLATTPHTLLTSLDHHISLTHIDPKQVNDHLTQASLNCCSESESDVDDATLATAPMICGEYQTDSDSADSSEEAFPRATVMTEEESLLRIKHRLLRLQSLYKDQITNLHHLQRDRRREYLQNIQEEKETLCSIAQQCATSKSPHHHKVLKKIAAYKRYMQPTGQVALLRRKQKEKRMGESGEVGRVAGSRCTFAESGMKCSMRSVPELKFCLKHVLHDSSQLLFKPCLQTMDPSVEPCQEPVAVFAPCVYHTQTVPSRITYNSSLWSSDDDENDQDGTNTNHHEIKEEQDMPSEEGEIKGDVLMYMEYAQEEIVVTDDT